MDFKDFIPDGHATEAFDMLDAAGTGKITLQNLRDVVVAVFQ